MLIYKIKKYLSLVLIILFSILSITTSTGTSELKINPFINFNKLESLIEFMDQNKLAAIDYSTAKENKLDTTKAIKIRININGHEFAQYVKLLCNNKISIIIPPKNDFSLYFDYYLVPKGWYKLSNGIIYKFKGGLFYPGNPFTIWNTTKDINLSLAPYRENLEEYISEFRIPM